MRFSNLLLILFFFSVISFSNKGYAQKGFKYCPKDLIEDYDFRAQSGFAWLAAGDTAYIKVVLYSRQDYRIFTCGPSKLGQINFRIIEEIKNREKKMRDVINNDTIWIYETTTTKEVIFDSNAGENVWEATMNKTKRLSIEVTVNEGGSNKQGVVDILVGQKLKSTKRFYRPRK